MKKIRLIALSTMLSILVIASINFVPDSKPHFDIVYLDETAPTRLSESRFASIKGKAPSLWLDPDRDAYVLNKVSFSDVVPESAQDYLVNGGIILVNDNSVTYSDIIEKIDTNVIPFDYSSIQNQYGFYIVSDGVENIVTNVSLGYLTSETTSSSTTTDLTAEISKTTIVESVITTASTKAAGYFFEEDDNNTGPGIQTETSGSVIAEANLDNNLFSNDDGSYVCTYTIHTQVYDVAKVVRTGTVTPRGVYDVVSTFEVSPSPVWAVEKYKMRMMNTNSIIDAAALRSMEDTTVTLGGTIGFPYSVMAGALTNGPTYVNEDNDTYYNLDFSSTYAKYWEVVIPRTVLERDYTSIPSLRVVNSNDFLNTTQLSRMESLQVMDNGWWLIIKRMYMDPAYRKELKVVWNSYGLISQSIITG